MPRGIGEYCSGNPQFTHVSFDDFRILRDNLAGRNRLVPHIHRPATGACRIDQARGAEAENRRASRKAADERGASHPNNRRDKGIHEGLVAALRRSCSGLHDGGWRSWRGHGGRADGYDPGLPYGRLRDAVLARPTMAEELGALFSNVPER